VSFKEGLVRRGGCEKSVLVVENREMGVGGRCYSQETVVFVVVVVVVDSRGEKERERVEMRQAA
jgi:hypothetical protein